MQNCLNLVSVPLALPLAEDAEALKNRLHWLSQTTHPSVYQLIEDEYQVQQCRSRDRIISQVFPELTLTAEQVFAAAEV